MKRHSGQPSVDWPQYMASRASSPHAALARFYGAAWPDAETPMGEVEFMALDLETKGLDAQRHAIVSIGLIPVTLNRIRSDQAWYQVVRPQVVFFPSPWLFIHSTLPTS